MIGIDYSMSNPAMVDLYRNQVYCLAKKPDLILKHWKSPLNLNCLPDPGLEGVHRYAAIAELFVSQMNSVSQIAIEGYSFGSVGRVFQIGENTGILISRILQLNPNVVIFRPAPTTVKKLATGSGRAEKIQVLRSFEEASGTSELPVKSPFTDIADAFWVARSLGSQIPG